MMGGEGFLARIIPATRILQSLTKRGKIKEKHVQEAENAIKDVQQSFQSSIDEFSVQHLKEMEAVIKAIQDGRKSSGIINEISSSVANFRANVSMLKEAPYIDICSIFLRWSESIRQLDSDAIEIIHGYYNSMNKIIGSEGLPEKYVKAIYLEVREACQRYFDKHLELSMTENINNSKAMYITETSLGCDLDVDGEGHSPSQTTSGENRINTRKDNV